MSGMFGLPDKAMMDAGAYAMAQGGHQVYLPRGGMAMLQTQQSLPAWHFYRPN